MSTAGFFSRSICSLPFFRRFRLRPGRVYWYSSLSGRKRNRDFHDLVAWCVCVVRIKHACVERHHVRVSLELGFGFWWVRNLYFALLGTLDDPRHAPLLGHLELVLRWVLCKELHGTQHPTAVRSLRIAAAAKPSSGWCVCQMSGWISVLRHACSVCKPDCCCTRQCKLLASERDPKRGCHSLLVAAILRPSTRRNSDAPCSMPALQSA